VWSIVQDDCRGFGCGSDSRTIRRCGSLHRQSKAQPTRQLQSLPDCPSWASHGTLTSCATLRRAIAGNLSAQTVSVYAARPPLPSAISNGTAWKSGTTPSGRLFKAVSTRSVASTTDARGPSLPMTPPVVVPCRAMPSNTSWARASSRRAGSPGANIGWVRLSTNPGITTRPEASISRVPRADARFSTRRLGPASSIFSFRIRTAPSGTIFSSPSAAPCRASARRLNVSSRHAPRTASLSAPTHPDSVSTWPERFL
jgi:hypothetical protein